MWSTVVLMTRIEQAANAMAVNATRYVLSMPAHRASGVPRFSRVFDGFAAWTRGNPAIAAQKVPRYFE